jgi:hypothetical protein
MKYSQRSLMIVAILAPAVLAGPYYFWPHKHTLGSAVWWSWDDEQRRLFGLLLSVLVIASLVLLKLAYVPRLRDP